RGGTPSPRRRRRRCGPGAPRRPPPRTPRRRRAARRAPRLPSGPGPSCLLVEDPGDAEALLLGGGRPGEGLLGREGRPYLVGPVDVGQRQRVRGGRDVLRGDLLHPRDRGDDLVELGREMIELIVGERQPGQPGEVLDLVTGDGGHDEKPFLRIDWDSRTILCLLQCPRRQAPGRLPSTGTARDRCIAPTRPGARCAIRSSLRSNL